MEGRSLWRRGRRTPDGGGSAVVVIWREERDMLYFPFLSPVLAHALVLNDWMAHLLELVFSLLCANLGMENRIEELLGCSKGFSTCAINFV
ncbi:Os08g0302100 [Oryza sativa Japonica Group]|uniref:Os08g0302100 protein n=2 Tax=Oryza sativa subsp. japonica TaxID=39947 RepID=Q0J6K3_ORYSJ|nr:Os08g0302100 [Oryza sativa Japonica Group]BAT04817.1 Os08g0302100 [Oryza sativa Japonica Group]|eukprot:NP_001061498.1 Os08g0302100 [Oryza sativa Japonica Group]